MHAPHTLRYKNLRRITISMTALMLPIGTYVGFQLGSGNTKTALIALGIQTLLTFAQAHLWWLTLEKEQAGKSR